MPGARVASAEGGDQRGGAVAVLASKADSACQSTRQVREPSEYGDWY